MQLIINQGKRSVSVSANDENGPFVSRLYVNCTSADAAGLGDATLITAKHKSVDGARKWAARRLAA